MVVYITLVNWVPLLLIIIRGNPWYAIYYFLKSVVIIVTNINNIRIKIIPLFNRFIIINNILIPDFI